VRSAEQSRQGTFNQRVQFGNPTCGKAVDISDQLDAVLDGFLLARTSKPQAKMDRLKQ
jgi:hypothetical protein